MLRNISKIRVILLVAFILLSSCEDKPKEQNPRGGEINNQAEIRESVQIEPVNIAPQKTENAAGGQSGLLQDTNATKLSKLPEQEPKNTTGDANQSKKGNAVTTEPTVPNAAEGQSAADSNSSEPNKSEIATNKTSEPNEPNGLKKSTAEEVSFNSRFSGIFSEYVDSQGLVNYSRLKIKRNDLRKALDEIAKLDPNEYKTWPKEEQIALWINAYNLRMLNIVADNYPIESNRFMRMIPGWEIDSIRHIDKSIGGLEKQKIIVMDEEFTLSSIEEERFYKSFNEPRCFFAISHLGLSGPPLHNEAYLGSKLNEQLTEQIKKYLSDARSFKIDTEKKTVYLPAILDKVWHGKYFTEKYRTNTKFKDQDETTGALLNFLINYLPAQDVSFLELQNYSVTYFGYNWRLRGR